MQTMEEYRGIGGTTPILNLGARWGEWSTCRPTPTLYTPLPPREKPRYQLTSKQYDLHRRMIKNLFGLDFPPT